MKRYLAVIVIMMIFIPLILGMGFFYYWVFTQVMLHWILRLLIALGTLAMAGAFLAVSIQRFKEIKEEDSDDLSKY
ncbi:hypothetical protein [Salinispira pacifica]|uniref:Uncharacterized protein n=1 Tax=Salinispira pacifica TaxID=1307761 RepID=V5WK99_9SPIO|nr:hypothetical protein [Salinispira pacifica]AHC16247.1 hypothetical protein L21SP2_2899 [Salinispira pacifica]